MREIERENYILLQKIMSCSNGPSKAHFSHNNDLKGSRKSSAAVNRKKKQRQIDLDNQILNRKLESIRRKKPAI
uniref:CSON011037 protein n=1 Tax=Culicoides sonorensis TaxID=179676 RepID=A0A336M2X0_CULSO